MGFPLSVVALRCVMGTKQIKFNISLHTVQLLKTTVRQDFKNFINRECISRFANLVLSTSGFGGLEVAC